MLRQACASAQSPQSLHCLLTQYWELKQASDKETHLWPYWKGVHAHLQDLRPHGAKIPFLIWQLSHLSRLMTKPTKWHVRPAKTQISLGICPVWSESLLSTWRKLGSLATHWVHSKDSDQTGRMPRLIWVFAGHTCHFVSFVTRRLICFLAIFVRLSQKASGCEMFLWQLGYYDLHMGSCRGL